MSTHRKAFRGWHLSRSGRIGSTGSDIGEDRASKSTLDVNSDTKELRLGRVRFSSQSSSVGESAKAHRGSVSHPRPHP